MKKTVPSLVLALFLFPSIAMGVTVKYEDLVKLEGLHYYKFTGEPFTGKVTGKTQGSFKNGKRYGAWVIYYDNGQLLIKGTYKDGKKNGPWVGYKKDGTEEGYFTGTYKNGVKVK